MKVLIVGSGLSGLYASYKLASKQIDVVLVSPEIPERSQSVMAAGGINGAINTMKEDDNVALHIQETFASGKNIADYKMVENLCQKAPFVIEELAQMGVMFNRNENNEILCRAFGGQSKKRTAFAGASTGKQIITALTGQIRKFQQEGKITHLLKHRFLSALIKDGTCYGCLFYDELNQKVVTIYSDAVIMATGGQNSLFGKTTGSTLDDGYSAAKLFTQGVTLQNLEFIQYHPTTIETSAKQMLISEAARGEGGRLFYYNKDGSRCYFLEDKYGPKGNLQSRDIVSKEMFDTHQQVYLDISFLGKEIILKRLREIYDICMDYLYLDVTTTPIPVKPSVHFFMGGIKVDEHHQTNIQRLFAIGECACAYHGANRLGGNSLLAACVSAITAAEAINKLSSHNLTNTFENEFKQEQEKYIDLIQEIHNTTSKFPAVYIKEEIAKILNRDLGILRNEKTIKEGLTSLQFYDDASKKITFDGTLTPYEIITLPSSLILAKAILLCALNRKESRGAHIRSDYPNLNNNYEHPTIVNYIDEQIIIGG